MNRCLQLAANAAGYTAPNPKVGSVLVYNDRIIGEGYHKLYGEAHAEVNCINSVSEVDRHLIPRSELYVSLEPCAHFGKTPPCTDFIIKNKIPKVVVGCRDPFVKVNGKGIEKLKESGIDVITNICENDCKEINKRFFTFHTQHRPFIVLKWAQSMDGKIANEDYSRLFISNEFTNRMVHKWRSEEMAILIGTNTAFFDDPSLTVRHWPGQNPIRLVLDMHLRLPENLKLFKTSVPTIVFNAHKHSLPFGKVSTTDLRNLGLSYYQITEDVNIVHQLVNAIYSLGIQSVLVEGGAQLLQSFIDENCWDESRLIVNEQLFVGNGFPAPILSGFTEISKESYYSDVVRIFKNNSLTI